MRTEAFDQGMDPHTGEPTGAPVAHTSVAELDRICRTAATAAPALAAMSPPERAALLRALGAALEAHRDEIVELAVRETGLGAVRLAGELTRAVVQFELFADALDEGSVLEAVIDPADPAARPAPRPDLRRMLVPLGPVAVFAASNFPLAFSVPGGDTASALAAGCPVVVKAHPGHPALSARCGQILADACVAAGAPTESLAVVHGMAAGRALVTHPAVTAVGFTGSVSGGRALYDLASARPDPIPFYGELGSLNPVVVTPRALATRGSAIVAGFVESLTLGAGQFCTKPGLLLLPAGHGLADALAKAIEAVAIGPVLNQRIRDGYLAEVSALATVPGVRTIAAGAIPAGPAGGAGYHVTPWLLEVAAPDLVANAEKLLVECFGPAALVIEYADRAELDEIWAVLPGGLTATVHATLPDEDDLAGHLIDLCTARSGRVIWDGWPTGVAVTWAMQHGGPWPATTGSIHTSVGTTAVRRFQRPVSYQNVPQRLLPPALQDGNPLGIVRRRDGVLGVDGRD
ncbi:aldehyde dehydrogenase (NADP(+)) [Plantactinospora soyae]|uniref:NADP-dependent aldehyde dehydrogenase n=1 Tax=Plantactinospora soyae TaxID=1544732 RepID=A0A927MBX8_9ACTN|nr:aldehyde dehydrogenase (NADP(+)) [Plantactinospora soyae]MBE1491644.1 NADP-dependent aldehyde dehydrogenase [Plantactinospora soyae]